MCLYTCPIFVGLITCVHFFMSFVCRCHCLTFATSKILNKLAEICHNTADHTAILLMTIKLYLSALSAYYKSSQLVDNDLQVTGNITDAQVSVIKWLLKPEVGLGDYFGGKSGKKIKEEIKVC